MKKLAIFLFAITVIASASAQKRVFTSPRVIVAPRPVFVSPHPYYYSRPYTGFRYGYGFGYNPFFYGSLGYPYYGYPGYYRHPSKLDRQVMDIEQDYSDRIESVRLDKSLSGRERRQQMRGLRRERKEAVYDAKRNYYKQPYSNYSNPDSNNNY